MFKPAIRLESLRLRKTEASALFGHSFEPEQIISVRSLDRDAESIGQSFGPGRMIQMRVGQQDLLNVYPM